MGPYRHRAFTVVELAVVTAVAVAVTATLLPSVAKVRTAAKRYSCITNMHTILQASIGYGMESKGGLPQPGWLSIEVTGKKWTGASWLYKWERGFWKPKKDGSAPGAVTKGALWPLIRDMKIFRCPEHTKDNSTWFGTQHLTSYIVNGSVCAYGRKWDRMFSASSFRSDDIIYVEGDEQSRRGGVWNDGSNWPWEGLSSRHDLGSIYGTADGSVGWIYSDDLWKNEIRPAGRPTRMWNVPGSKDGRRL